MGSEHAVIEEEDKIPSPMQLNNPASIPLNAGDIAVSNAAGGGSGGGDGSAFQERIKQMVRGRGPGLIDGDDNNAAPLIEEEEKEPEKLASSSSGASLIKEDDDEDEEAAPQAPALDKSQLRPDVLGARDLAENAGATPGRNWVEAGEILQGDANSARRRGEGRYGAAALHGIADLAVSAGSGEAGGAAAGVVKGAMKPLAAPAMVGKLAGDAVKYTVGGLVSAGGQAVQKIGDNKRDALDPAGILEQQQLVDVANRHEHGIDMTSEEQGLTRREEVAARGVRMEQGDKAKKIWNGPKKRSWGRIAQNAIMSPVRGIAKAVKSLVTSPAAGLKSSVNFFSKYGRKFGNWASNNSWNRKRRANNALERLRERSEANGEERHPAAPADALTADSPIKPSKFLNFRGADAAIRSHTRDVRKAQGFDNILGQKDYEKLSEGDRREYREKENVLLKTSPKYANAMDKAASDSEIIKGIAQKFPDPHAQAQGDQQQAPANAPPGNAAAGADNDDFEMISDKDAPDLGNLKLAKDSHPGMSIAAGIDKGVGLGEQLVETSKKLDAPVGLVTNFLGQQLPDMLEGQALEDYVPHAESAKAVGETFKSINENAALYRAPLIGKGLHTGFDLYKTAKQSANREKDPNETALNERRTLEDTREMSDRVRALLQAKKDAGASEESIARTKRLRNKMLMLRLVTANRKLAKAQEMNGITPLNEYSKKESDFIGTGDYTKNKEEGAKGVGELGKEAGKATVKTLKAMFAYTGANKADDTKEADRLYGPGGKFPQGGDAPDLDPADLQAPNGAPSQVQASGSGDGDVGGPIQNPGDGVQPLQDKGPQSVAKLANQSAKAGPLIEEEEKDASSLLDPQLAPQLAPQLPPVPASVMKPDEVKKPSPPIQEEEKKVAPQLAPQLPPVPASVMKPDEVKKPSPPIQEEEKVAPKLAPQLPPVPASEMKPANQSAKAGPLIEEEEKVAPPRRGANTGRTGEDGDGSQNLDSARKIDNMFQAGRFPRKPFDDAAFAKRETPVYDVYDGEPARYQADLRAEGFQDVSTRHEGLDLPSAFVHVPDEPDDLPNWAGNFSDPGELNFFDNQDETIYRDRDMRKNPDAYAPQSNEIQESEVDKNMRVQATFLAREKARQRLIDIPSKRPVVGNVYDGNDPGSPTPDAKTHSGPMTIGKHPVVPEIENPGHNPDEPYGGWWTNPDTGQRLGYAGLAGNKPVVSPANVQVQPRADYWQGFDVARQKKREVIDQAKREGVGENTLGNRLGELSENEDHQPYGGVADENIVQVPSEGIEDVGAKPKFWQQSAKKDYLKKTQALNPIIDNAWSKMKGEELPIFLKGNSYAENVWKKRQKELELEKPLQEKLERLKNGDPGPMLR